VQLFGAKMTRRELLRHVGGLQQIGGVQLMSMEEGHGRGSRLADFRTGTGFRFSVMVDRGMDPGYCEFQGASLAWIPARRFPAPWYFDGTDVNWVRVALGGLCNTCGLVHIGNPQDIDTEYYGWTARETDRYGVHDRVAVTPAERFSYGERWDGDRCFLWAEGTVREEIVYGENLVLTRRYEAELGQSRFTIDDIVTNEGHYPSPHQLLYHFNIGYPIVDDGAELLASVSGPVPGSMFEEGAAAQTEKYRTFVDPTPEFRAEGYEIPVAADDAGLASVAIANRGFSGSVDGIGAYLKYDSRTLPTYIEWRMMGEGLYAVGMEPATNPFSTVPDLVASGYPVMIQPGESRQYHLEFGVLAGNEAIDGFAASLPKSAEQSSPVPA
jgi:Domain of unknown function (DUF4432)